MSAHTVLSLYVYTYDEVMQDIVTLFSNRAAMLVPLPLPLSTVIHQVTNRHVLHETASAALSANIAPKFSGSCRNLFDDELEMVRKHAFVRRQLALAAGCGQEGRHFAATDKIVCKKLGATDVRL